ncbi:MAG: hypothetical protein ACKOFI_08135, partial [Phycisphaerales bacterium]
MPRRRRTFARGESKIARTVARRAADGAWHARGTALDRAWSAQLNPFLTLATLEWRLGVQRRRIRRHARGGKRPQCRGGAR